MRSAITRLDHGFDAAFGAAANPLKHLGASAFLLLALLAATGIVLYIVLDTSAQGAYRSIEDLSRGSFTVGSALRGLHRYAADAFVFVTLLHLAREALLGRFGAFRRYSWTTGVVLLPIMAASAIGGFWLTWDRLAQYSATSLAQWVDTLPLFVTPLARNFLSGAVGDRLFSLLVFVHLGLPLLLLFGAWAHVRRIGHVDWLPNRTLAVGTTVTLVALALAVPVHGQGAAELSLEPQRLALDWWLLALQPAADAAPLASWVAVALVLTALFSLPLVAPRHAPAAARVDASECSGCGRCVDDCPFAAISLVPHPLRHAGVQLAQVNAVACASCGICTGACPSSSPFRKGELLATGIDLPQLPITQVRERLRAGLASGARRVVFGCERGARIESHVHEGVFAIGLPCIAMLPPAFVEYAVRLGASDVLVTGCREGGCEFRLGPQWMQARLAGMREPHLREMEQGTWRVHWADAAEALP
jgi:ferredoxin